MMLWQRKLRYRLKRSGSVRRGNRRRGLRWVCLGMVLLGAIWGFYRIEGRIGTLAQEAALSELNGSITKEVNRVVQEVMRETGAEPQRLVPRQTDESGKVLSLTTDYAVVNQVKSELAIRMQQSLDTMDTIESTVPVGMLFSDTFLTGVGFRIPVRVFITNAIAVEFMDEFASAGINQSRYRLMLEVKVPARVAGVFRSAETEIVTQIPIAETILVGEVPQMYVDR